MRRLLKSAAFIVGVALFIFLIIELKGASETEAVYQSYLATGDTQ